MEGKHLDQLDTVKEGERGSKQAMLSALEKTLGIVKLAADMAGVPRSTHYFWMKEDSDYAKEVTSIDNIALDFAESQLHSLIKAKNVAAVIFYLKTKGKNRGYLERIETVAATFTVGFDD